MERTLGETEKAGIGVRIAVYPRGGEPEVTEAAAANPRSATTKFTRLVLEKVREVGGRVPEESVREVIENLVHAGYRGVVISVLEDGNVVRVSDKGPGVEHKEQAMEFGFSGATPEALGEIRGVGAGLGIARAAAERRGGTVVLEDNIGDGTVATISVPGDEETSDEREPAAKAPPQRKYPDGVPRMNISERQQKVLITVLECGEVGPSTVADRLEISVSTAYRDLSVLEEHGLLIADESGKRFVSPLGRDLVEAIVSTWVK
jgi:DNA-binding transcriptional ArsR family regulator